MQSSFVGLQYKESFKSHYLILSLERNVHKVSSDSTVGASTIESIDGTYIHKVKTNGIFSVLPSTSNLKIMSKKSSQFKYHKITFLGRNVTTDSSFLAVT